MMAEESKNSQHQTNLYYQQPKLIVKKKQCKFGLKLNIPNIHNAEQKEICNVKPKAESQSQIKTQTETQIEPITSLDKPSSIFEEQKLKKQERFYKKYKIGEQILGQGANGIVKKCLNMDEKDGLNVYAVKITKCQMQQMKNMIESFTKITKFDHKNIIKYKSIYVSTTKNKAFLVMQYIPFKDLSKAKIKSQDQLKQIAQQIIEAVGYMHDKGICHRDLKPQNILYDPTKNSIKIVDFGSSAIFIRKNKPTQMATPTGTILYRPPERVNFTGSYNELIDEWAIGVILFKLVTGKTPFQDQTHDQTIENIRRGTFQFDQQIWANYSKELKDLIKQLMKPIGQRITAKQALLHVWFPGNKNNLLQSSHANIKKPKVIKTGGQSHQPLLSSQQLEKFDKKQIKDKLTTDEEMCVSQDEYQADVNDLNKLKNQKQK